MYLVVLVAGMSTMATEMAASRLLAPFFGSSIMVWANIIGLILIYLSLGYWWGGRIADRYPRRAGLAIVTLVAATSVMLLPFIEGPVLSLASGGLESLSVGVVIGSFFGSLLLFIVPITALGMVPPYAIRLAIKGVDTAGAVSGRLYALSTIGSIIGTFASVLLLIPAIGVQRTFLAAATALALLSIAGDIQRVRIAAAGVAVLSAALFVFVSPGSIKASEIGEVIYETESHHQYIQVSEKADGSRYLQLNEGWSVHSEYHPDTIYTGGIWDHFALLPQLQGDAPYPVRSENGEPLRFLIIGNAAGSAARAYRELYPNIEIDGVEIDEDVSRVGLEYFDMGGPNLTVHTADGRPFLRTNEEEWDLILIDAYRQPYIPFYLTTHEFFELVDDRLAPGGVAMMNVGATPEHEEIQQAIITTALTVFDSAFRYRAETFNELLVVTKEDRELTSVVENVAASELADDQLYDHVVNTFLSEVRIGVADDSDPLTDDRAPVEWMTDTMILEYAAEGQ